MVLGCNGRETGNQQVGLCLQHTCGFSNRGGCVIAVSWAHSFVSCMWVHDYDHSILVVEPMRSFLAIRLLHWETRQGVYSCLIVILKEQRVHSVGLLCVWRLALFWFLSCSCIPTCLRRSWDHRMLHWHVWWVISARPARTMPSCLFMLLSVIDFRLSS